MATQTSPNRVTNVELRDALAEFNARLGRIEERVMNIEEVVTADSERVRNLQTESAGQNPLVNKRLDLAEKRLDKHGCEIDELTRLVKEVAHSQKIVNWVAGLLGAGLFSWLIAQLLALI